MAEVTHLATAPYELTLGTRDVAQSGSECVATQHESATLTTDDIITFSPNSGVLYPGSLVGLESVEGGTLTSRNVEPGHRAPLSLTISDIATAKASPDVSETIKAPSFAATEAARARLMAANPVPATSFAYSTHEYYSLEQSMLSLGVSAHWISGSVTASMQRSSATYKSGFVVSFKQRLCTMSIEPPESPSAVFSGTTLEGLQTVYGKPSPQLGYVSSVTYGRWILLTAESTYSREELKATLDAAYNAATAGATVNLSAEQLKILSASKLQYFVLGGTNSLVTPIKAADMVSTLKQLLGTPMTDIMSSAAPLSFRVNYLKDNSLKQLHSATDFALEERHPFLLENFVAHFHTNDDDKDDDTALDVHVWDNDHAIASGSDHSKNKYDNNSDHDVALSGSIVPSAMSGKLLRICISPDGNDTWKFNVSLTASNGYSAHFDGHSLKENNRCEATPLPASSLRCQ